MNAKAKTIAAAMQLALTFPGHIAALATVDFLETALFAKTLTNAQVIPTTAVPIVPAPTPSDRFTARAKLVIQEMA